MRTSSSFRNAIASTSRLAQQHAASSASVTVTEFIAFPEFVRRGADAAAAPATEDLPQEEASAPTIRQSKQARDGSRGRIGMVELPTELQLAVNRMVEGADKPRIRQRALALYDHLRSSSSAPPTKDQQQQVQGPPTSSKPFMDGPTALAYTAGVMPSIYASTRAVLGETKVRLGQLVHEGEEEWIPKQIVDWGAGVGTGGWAAQQVWPDDPLSYVSLDSSRSLQAISSALLAPLPSSTFQKKLHQTSLGSPDLTSLISSSFPSVSSSETLSLAAYTLGDMPTDKMRRETVRAMWDSGAEVIVIVDRGTPKGADVVKSAREQLIRLGKHNAARGKGKEVDMEDELVIGGETFVAEVSPEQNEDNIEIEAESILDTDTRGCYVVAPCPHEGRCPLHKTKSFCHFSQKVQRPSFLRKTKHSGSNKESSSYSYVVIRRGTRPSLPSPNNPRLVVPPLKRGGHVILDACTPNGHIERWTIAKSYGKQEYYDARKSRWGDSFPHYNEEKSIKKYDGLKKGQSPI